MASENARDLTDADAKLFIANISFQTTNDTLRDIFSKYGNLTEVRVAVENGRSRGYAFVTMEQAQDAIEAVKNISGMEVDGRQIKVEVSTGDSGRSGRGSRGPGMCYDFQRGECSRGDTCKFSHGGADERGDSRRDDRDRRRSGDRRDDRHDRDRRRSRSRDRRDRDDDRSRRDRRRDLSRSRSRDRGDRKSSSSRHRDRSRDRDDRRDRDRGDRDRGDRDRGDRERPRDDSRRDREAR